MTIVDGIHRCGALAGATGGPCLRRTAEGQRCVHHRDESALPVRSGQSPPFTGDFRRMSDIEYLSEVPLRKVCLLHVGKDGAVTWVAGSQVTAKRELAARAAHGGRLYFVWGGQWSDDLFLVDDLDALRAVL